MYLPDGLQEGQEVLFGVGDARAPAYAIAHAYGEIPVSVRVDYFGDGREYKLWPPLVISVVPDRAAKLAVVLPSLSVGEAFRVRIRAEDVNSNIGPQLKEKLHLVIEGTAGICEEQKIRANSDGTCILDGLRVSEPGIYRARVMSGDLNATSNAMECVETDTSVCRGMTAGHYTVAHGTSRAATTQCKARSRPFALPRSHARRHSKP